MNLRIAIDPGASGGIAWENDSGTRCMPMPETDGDVKNALYGIIFAGPNASPNERVICHIEKVGGFIAGAVAPGSMMFDFGFRAGFLQGVLSAYNVPVLIVTPQRWQKVLGLGTREHAKREKGRVYSKEELKLLRATDARYKTEWKNRLKSEAQRRFPALNVTLKTADALLILEAGKLMEGSGV